MSQVQNISRNPFEYSSCLVSVPIRYSSRRWWGPADTGGQQGQVYVDVNASGVDGGQELLSMARVIKVLSTRPDDPISTPGIHMVEGESFIF